MGTAERKEDIYKPTPDEWRKIAEEIGFEAYRGEQVFRWIHKKRASDFSDMRNVRSELLERLSGRFLFPRLELVRTVQSVDGSRKIVFELGDGARVESVLIPEGKRLTLCISTQVGCPVGCIFCQTGLMGFQRNLSPGEILLQYYRALNLTGSKITNVVYMGMGEPLLNYEATLRSIRNLTASAGQALSWHRITLSTIGIARAMKRLVKSGIKANLAISVHSTNEDLRAKLIPPAERNSLTEVLKLAKRYRDETDAEVTLEFLLFEGLNDNEREIRNLSLIAKRTGFKINLMNYNRIPEASLVGAGSSREKRSLERLSEEKALEFLEGLRGRGVTATLRKSRGQDVSAACGMLGRESESQGGGIG